MAQRGKDAVATEAKAQKLARDLESVYARHRKHPNFPQPTVLSLALSSIIKTAKEWRELALVADEARQAGQTALVAKDVLLLWWKLAGINIK